MLKRIPFRQSELLAMLAEDPLWHLEMYVRYQYLNALQKEDPVAYQSEKERYYDVIEKALTTGRILTGSNEGAWEDERLPVTKAVFTQTHNKPGNRLERLEAIGLLRSYVPAFNAAKKSEKDRKLMDGQPIFSGHKVFFRQIPQGRQGFQTAHYLLRQDGRVERLLVPSKVGWHAGNWDINCCSIGIMFDGNFDNEIPSDAAIYSAGTLVLQHKIKKSDVWSHAKASGKGTSPSPLWNKFESRITAVLSE